MLHRRPLLSLLLLIAAAPAQGTAVIPVKAGREFVLTKLLTPGITDVCRVDLEADEVVRCVVESASFDPVLELVDPAGAVLVSDDGEGTRSEVRWRAATKGAFELHVKPFRGSGGGNYTFRMMRFRTAPLGTSSEATHTFGVERWWHWRVTLKRGEQLVPTALGQGHVSAVLDDRLTELPDQLRSYRAPADGDYYLRIEGPEGCTCQTLTQLARTADLPVDTERSESLPPFGLDELRVALRAGQLVETTTSIPGDALIATWHEETPSADWPSLIEAPIAFAKPGRTCRYHFVRRDCTAILRFRSTRPTAVAYRAAVRAAGTPCETGTAVAAELHLGRASVHELQLTAGQLVRLAATTDRFDGQLALHDVDGNQLARVDDGGPADPNPSLVFLVPRTATYRVFVATEGGAGSGPYTFTATVLDVPRLEAGGATDVRVDEGPAHVHVDLGRDEVVWLSVQSREIDAMLQVLDPTGDSGFVADGGGVDGDVLVAFRARQAGTHTLLVHARSGHGTAHVRMLRP